MAWTAPRTWTDGELVTATMMNTHVRDNLLAIGQRFHIRKASTESVTSSAVLQNDNDLVFAIAANEVWVADYRLFVTGATTGDIQWDWSVPAGCSGTHGQHSLLLATTASTSDIEANAEVALSTAGSAGIIAGETMVLISAVFVNAGTAGNVQFRWAQQTSSGTATNVLANSYLIAERFA